MKSLSASTRAGNLWAAQLLLWAALPLVGVGLLLCGVRPTAARAQESDLKDLQQTVTRAIDHASPVVVRVISPELTKEQRDALTKAEHERRLLEQQAASPAKPEKSDKPATDAPKTDKSADKANKPEKEKAPDKEKAPANGKKDKAAPPASKTPDKTNDKADSAAKAEKSPSPEKSASKDATAKTDQPASSAETAAKAAATAETAAKPVEYPGKTSTRTGLLVSADGCVVTSLGNIGLQKDYLKVELPDGRVLPAKRLGQDLRRDVVLLKIEADKLPVPEAARKSDLRVGQWVLALGRTLPVDQPTVNKGIISALGRMSGVAIQTDADVSPMNFGGPLVDLRGRVVAMVAAVSIPMGGGSASAQSFSDSGIGFAIPLEDILAELPQLRAGQTVEPPFLGIQFNMIRLDKGALVTDVLAGTGAATSGLAKGDVIVEFQGRTIETPFQLLFEISSRNVGDKVSFKVLRGDKTLTLNATLTARPERYR